MGSLAWQKYSPAHCQARDHQVQSWHLTSKYVSFIAFRLPEEKVYRLQTNEQEKTISAQEVQREEKEQQEDKEVSTNPQEEVEDAYATDSENAVEEDDDGDSLTFIRAVTTRSGRKVRVKLFS